VSPETARMPMRKVPLTVVVGLVFCVLPILAWAQPLPPGGGRSTVVDCAAGQKIAPRLSASRVALIIKGTCVENLVVAVDDVSITTDGVTPATITPADPTQNTIRFEGSRRVVIDGGAPRITINGGAFGIVATRGANVDVRNCIVTNTSSTGLIASYGSSLVVDNCTINGNAGNGAGAANTSSLVVTNSAVTSNGGIGLFATRSSYLRVGQDVGGTAVVRPVTVSGSGTNGIAITEGSAGNIVGGTVETSTSTNVFVGRASSGQIGVGSNFSTPAAGVTIRNGLGSGVSVEGSNATIVFGSVTGNALTGIIISNAGSARIGLLNGNNGYGPINISGNVSEGIHVSSNGMAFIGGATINGNGTALNQFGRHGIGIHQGGALLAGDNVITNNGEAGIFVRAGHVLVGNAGFGLTTNNTISGNGSAGPTTGGINAFQGGNALVNNATISNNTGAGVQAFEASVVELRGTTTVTVPAAGSTPGAVVQFGSTLRLRDTASIVSATGDGIQAANLSAVNINGNTVQGNGGGSVGIECFNVAPAPASGVMLTGNLAAVTGNAGPTTGCNVFP
jgi:hypothetical protein